MRILVIGGGGREHALVWKIKQSESCEALFCAPGNPGISELAKCVPIDLKPPFAALTQWCREHQIGLVVVGPEEPLANGMADALAKEGILAFGPVAAGARIEASKEFAKEIMTAAGIPTAKFRAASKYQKARQSLSDFEPPYVIKADGLAAGKGVLICGDITSTDIPLRQILEENVFLQDEPRVVIEEFIRGTEASLLAFTDGTTVLAMQGAQDYKRVGDGDQGPNTGGMGSVSPAAVLTESLRAEALETILKPAVAELRKRGITYRGVLYAGLMITPKNELKVIEFNCRFGDPETQALLPRLETDLVEVMVACATGTLDEIDLRWSKQSCVCVVAASKGYPGAYDKGKVIHGLDEAEKSGAFVFHAGTASDAAGQVVTSGGRVLGVTALGKDFPAARDNAYAAMEKISFEGMHFRRDIGSHAG